MDPALEAAALGANAHRAKALAAAISPDGTRAVVLTRFENGHALHRLCARREDGWAVAEDDPACSAGACWSSREEGGVWHISGQVPTDVTSVTFTWRGKEYRIEVKHGFFVAAWWDLPDSAFDDRPELVRYTWADGRETTL